MVWQSVFAIGGLAAWAAALPASPFFSISGYTTAIGGVIVIISPAVPMLADIVGIAPPKD